jgi:hypothetical protein
MGRLSSGLNRAIRSRYEIDFSAARRASFICGCFLFQTRMTNRIGPHSANTDSSSITPMVYS